MRKRTPIVSGKYVFRPNHRRIVDLFCVLSVSPPNGLQVGAVGGDSAGRLFAAYRPPGNRGPARSTISSLSALDGHDAVQSAHIVIR